MSWSLRMATCSLVPSGVSAPVSARRNGRLAAPRAQGRIDGAVAHEADLDVAIDGAELRQHAGRAAIRAGALAVRHDAPGLDADRMVQLVDLDAVVERHAAIAHGEEREPAVVAEGPRAAAARQDHLVDEECTAMARIA